MNSTRRLLFDHEECRGCQYIRILCTFRKYEVTNLCPCLECLVKPICKKGCSKRTDKALNIMKNKMRIELIKDYCKGCTVANVDCAFKDFKIVKDCPCIDCLIKPICKIGCDKRQRIFDYFIEKRKEKLSC